MKTIAVLIMGLWAASWAEAQEPVATADQMLPLAVGNSWNYRHRYFNELMGLEETLTVRDLTICITHTEDIEGHTYYVFSPMPYEDHPMPSFFLAGQKVRLDGNNLVFRGREGDIALYQFKFGAYGDYSYSIPEVESDTLVVVSRRMNRYFHFNFRGHEESIPESFFTLITLIGYIGSGSNYSETRFVGFTRGLGLSALTVEGLAEYENPSSSVNDVYLVNNLPDPSLSDDKQRGARPKDSSVLII